MASFSTHFTVGAAVSAMAATALVSIGKIDTEAALLLTFAGTLGGILPDIDSDHSRPLQIVFVALYALCAYILIDQLRGLSILELWVVLAGSYFLFRYALLPAFRAWTIHRGIFHSVLAGIFFCFLTCALLFQFYQLNPGLSWLGGGFVFLGFIAHLLLDEFYSVDFNGKRLKRSFGTALKLVNTRNWGNTFIFLVGTGLAFQMTPASHEFTQLIFNKATYVALFENFFPAYLTQFAVAGH
ncbi:metal-dependent hydrolase [Candidatus Venteria ishoeyi]|uniref:metal-dependent hydrolase n=1 Tax=Candidatus Venteria ishoeyi TaxID=1899563 RepID=UPI0025A588F6|nr:metal-dependent hydrolase [Candidatus Venteria ishoeyi]MDM8546912.1 metal-dependent hydrolase [Candidatus Venteria ishoeyi]